MAGRIKGITIEIDGNTSGLDKALSDVNKRSRDLQKELSDVSKLLKFNPGNAELLSQKQAILAKSIQTTTEKLNQLKSAESQVQSQFEKGDIGEDQYRAFQREIVETESKLQHFETQLKESQDKVKQFADKLGNVSEKFKDVGNKMNDVGKDMSTKVTLPIVGLGAAIVKTGADFEESMSNVQAVTGASTSDMKKLSDQAKDLGANTQFSAKQAADAMGYLGQAGFNTQQIMTAMPAVLDMATSGQMDLASAADIASNVINGFNLSAKDTTHVSDVLAKSAAATNADIQGLGSAMSYVAPVAAGAGLSFEETAAAIGELSNAGIKGERAGTALRGMISALQNPTGQTAQALKKLGVSAKDVNPSAHSLTEILETLKQKGVDSATAMQLVGQESGPGLIALLNQGSGGLTKLTSVLVNSDGAAKQMAKTMTDNANGGFKNLMSAIENLALTISDILLPYVKQLTDKVTEWARKFADLSPTTQKMILVLAGIAAAIGPLLVIFGQMAMGIGAIITVVSTLIPIITAAGVAIGAMSAPILIIIGVIGALIAAGVLLYTHWNTVKEKAIEIWNSISKFFSKITSDILNIVKERLGIDIYNTISNYLNMTWNIIKSIFGFIRGTFENALDFLKALVHGDFQGMIDVIHDQMKLAFDTITGIWNSIIDFFKGIDLKQIGVDIIEGLIDGIGSMASAVWDKVKSIAGGIKNTIQSALGIHSPSTEMIWVGQMLGQGLADGITSMKDLVSNATNTLASVAVPSFSSISLASTLSPQRLESSSQSIKPQPVPVSADNHYHFNNLTIKSNYMNEFIRDIHFLASSKRT